MSTHIQSDPRMNELSEAAGDMARRAADEAKEAAQRATVVTMDVAKEITDATKDAAHCVTDTARDMCHSAALKARETLDISKDYVRRNPLPVVLGAIALGAAIGYTWMMARRKSTFTERYADEPLVAVREAILGALAPVAHRVHKGYDTAKSGAGKVIDRVHAFRPGRGGNSVSEQVGRIGNNLKFW